VLGAAAGVGAFSQLAVESGVRRLVPLSGRGEEEAQRSEQLVRESGVDWTILRSSWFSQNFSESFLVEACWAAWSRFRSPACGSRSWTPRTSPTRPGRGRA
jgi:uncharacterized protein YbjT (DUF2867 family)